MMMQEHLKRFKVPSGVLGNEGGVVIRINHNLCNGSHTTPKADQHADKADELQDAPLGGELPHTCSTITCLYTTAVKGNQALLPCSADFHICAKTGKRIVFSSKI